MRCDHPPEPDFPSQSHYSPRVLFPLSLLARLLLASPRLPPCPPGKGFTRERGACSQHPWKTRCLCRPPGCSDREIHPQAAPGHRAPLYSTHAAARAIGTSLPQINGQQKKGQSSREAWGTGGPSRCGVSEPSCQADPRRAAPLPTV